jgi:hypothetical protein
MSNKYRCFIVIKRNLLANINLAAELVSETVI